MDLQKYVYYLCNNKYLKLAQLPKLTQKQVAMHFGINEYFRALLHLYYGHYNLLLKCEKYNLFYCYDILGAAIRFNKLKQIKFLESRGYDFKNSKYFIIAATEGAIKSMKYLESIGCFIHSHKYNYNAFTNAVFYRRDIKVIRYIKSRGINIYKENPLKYPLLFDSEYNKAQIIRALYINSYISNI